MLQKLIAQVDNVTNIKLGSKVQKLHGQPPQVLLTVSFSVPAGDITKVGALLNYELKESPVRIHFYTEEVQASLDGALAAKNAGLKECPACKGAGQVPEGRDEGVDMITPCPVCHSTGKVPKDFSITGIPDQAAADKAFAAMGVERERLQTQEAGVAAPAGADAKQPTGAAAPAEPKRRGRKKKAVLPGTGELQPVQPGDNGSHPQAEADQRQKEFEGAGAGIDTDNDCAP